LQGNIPIQQILSEVQQRYHVYFIIPNLTNHWGDARTEKVWKKLLGDEHFIRLEDPNEICPLIASLVAANEGHARVADMTRDGIPASVTQALATLPVHRATTAAGVSGGPPTKRL
jgi:hypothetical protein